MIPPLSRRALLQRAALTGALFALPGQLQACSRGRDRGPDPQHDPDPDRERLMDWAARLGAEGLTGYDAPLGRGGARVGELAAGSPYVPGTLDAYLSGNSPAPSREPLTLSLTRFDCVTLVEACLAVARSAGAGVPTWERFGREVERMRYRGGERCGYASRLHYFSEWIGDGVARGLVRDLGTELGSVDDLRPLRFMTGHRGSYSALRSDEVFAEIATMERRLDSAPRHVLPAARIAGVSDRIETGDVLAFATAIPGLDVTHAALAYRDGAGVLRVLHAPLSGGVVEITSTTLPDYVAAIHRCTWVLVARPLRTAG